MQLVIRNSSTKYFYNNLQLTKSCTNQSTWSISLSYSDNTPLLKSETTKFNTEKLFWIQYKPKWSTGCKNKIKNSLVCSESVMWRASSNSNSYLPNSFMTDSLLMNSLNWDKRSFSCINICLDLTCKSAMSPNTFINLLILSVGTSSLKMTRLKKKGSFLMLIKKYPTLFVRGKGRTASSITSDAFSYWWICFRSTTERRTLSRCIYWLLWWTYGKNKWESMR